MMFGLIPFFMYKPAKYVFTFLFLLGVIAFIISDEFFFLFLLCIHALVLAGYAYKINLCIYIFCQSRSFINSISLKPFFYLFYFINICIYSIIIMFFLGYLLNFLTPIATQGLLNILEPLLFSINIWVSSVSIILILGHLYKIFGPRKYDLPEEI